MANLPFKGVTPVFVHRKYAAWIDGEFKADDLNVYFKDKAATPPDSLAWYSTGFVKFQGSDSFISENAEKMPVVVARIYERVLPGSVIRDKMAPILKETEIQKGEPLDRKEKAQIREEVLEQLLPKAFIRSTDIPVVFYCTESGDGLSDNFILIGTPSPRKADMVASLLLYTTFDDAPSMEGRRSFFTEQSLPQWLKRVCQQPTLGENDRLAVPNSERSFVPNGSLAVFKGDDKKSVRIANYEIDSEEIAESLQVNSVKELGLSWHDPDAANEDDMTPYTSAAVALQLSEAFTFKRFELFTYPWRSKGRDAFELEKQLGVYAEHVAGAFAQVLKDLIDCLGGVREDAPSHEGLDDDDPIGIKAGEDLDGPSEEDPDEL